MADTTQNTGQTPQITQEKKPGAGSPQAAQVIPEDTYELIENDKGEIMALIYADEKQPQNPSFALNENSRRIELERCKDDLIFIDGLQPEAIEKLKSISNLYVCEMKYNPDENAESEIVHAYIAPLKKKDREDPKPQEQPKQQSPQESLSEKARQARENILKKMALNQSNRAAATNPADKKEASSPTGQSAGGNTTNQPPIK